MSGMPRLRGIRGATTVEENNADAILTATKDLLLTIVDRNDLAVEEIASIFFTLSEDLDAVFPAEAARACGWHRVPLLCAREIPVPGALKGCIRVLMHVNTTVKPEEIDHVYLGRASELRPDLFG